MKNLITVLFLMIATCSQAQDYKLTYVQKYDIVEAFYQLNIVDQQTFWRKLSNKYIKKENNQVDPRHIVIHKKDKLDPISDYAHMDFESRTMMSQAKFNTNPLFLKDPMSKIGWTMQDSTAKVLGMDCQIATCSYLGRDYTAYFTTDIPLSYGPWKLHGLPGLILKVVTDRFTDIDHKEHIVIECLKIEKAPLTDKDKRFFQKFLKHKFVTHDEAVRLADKNMKFFAEKFKREWLEKHPTFQGRLANSKSKGTLEIIHPKLQSTGVDIYVD